MLKEHFIGRLPSHFVMNPIVKAFVISESFLWSAWHLGFPIFSIFVVRSVTGGTIETAATAYSIHLITRVAFELISARQLLTHSTDKKRLIITVLGATCMTLAYIGLAFSKDITTVFFFFALAGAGIGFASPAKNSLFSIHLDKNKEATEWSIADSVTVACMALAAALGGFIATSYGFKALYLTAAVINILATLPYLLFLNARSN